MTRDDFFRAMSFFKTLIRNEFILKISVVVPAYNAALYLSNCLNGLITQDFDDYEIIVVNDGSVDNTADIISGFDDGRIRVLHQENRGAYHARRNGILAAKGDYITFCDADDIPRVNWLSTIYEAAEETGADIIVSGYDRIDGETRRLIAREMCLSGVVETAENKLPLLFINTGLCNKLFAAHLLLDVYYPENPPRISEDAIFLASVYPRVNRVAFVKESLYDYIVRKGSLMMSAVGIKDIETIQEAFCGLRSYYPESMMDFFSIFTFLNVSVVLPLLYRGKSGVVVSNMYHFLEREAPDWKRVLTIKDVFRRPFRRKRIKIYIAVLCYRFHIFLPLVAVWRFVTHKMGISLKW